jgi:YegS/Rv2252/BmrU family lipid kinase
VKRYAFIYNPAAKGGRSDNVVKKMKMRIREFPNSKLIRSQNRGDISDLVRELKTNFDVFVACGGDGTIREVATSLISTDKVLGILPLGSGNDLVKTLGIPKKIDGAFSTLLNGRVVQMDVGECNDFFFMNSLGFGFDGLANRYAHDLQRLPGFFRYAIAALKANWKHERFSAEIQEGNETARENLIMISLANGRVEGGSFWIAPDASVMDGRLRMVKIKPVNRLLIPFLLSLFIIKKPHLISYVTHTDLTSAKISFDNPPEIHADGEIIETNQNEFEISVKAGALKVIC